jgi:prephenate dehydrogenase
MITRLCVIGVGLIGGSLAMALRRAGAVGEIVGSGRDERNLRRARELGVIDRFDLDPGRAAEGADLIVLAVPLGAMKSVCIAISEHVLPNAVLTDVGSAKQTVIDAATAALRKTTERFVPGHPIAGTERSGIEAAFADLFRERRVILTPQRNTAAEAIHTVRSMWEQTGALVEEMDAAHHDRVLAATSHLPHMLAYALVDSLSRLDDRDEVFRYAAGGFRDFTRIASSDPEMWRDICLANGDAIATMMARYRRELEGIEAALARQDGARLFEIFTRAKRSRDRFVA